MEYSLTLERCLRWWSLLMVLILILMEYSLTRENAVLQSTGKSLNPYSNGILTDIFYNFKTYHYEHVLILILMEYSLT